MRTAIVIPARYASTRLPAKPLLRETGKYLVQHVYEQAPPGPAASRRSSSPPTTRGSSPPSRASAAGPCMTRARPPVRHRPRRRGRPVARRRRRRQPAGRRAADRPGRRSTCSPTCSERDPAADMATLAVPIADEDAYRNPNCVKVVCDGRGRALYFSRSPIPFVRDGRPDFAASRRASSSTSASTPTAASVPAGLSPSCRPHPLEQLEKLEQLRVARRRVDDPRRGRRPRRPRRGHARGLRSVSSPSTGPDEPAGAACAGPRNGPRRDRFRYSDWRRESHRRPRASDPSPSRPAGDLPRMAKHIFVTGGVVSSLGKGLTCASIGMLLEHRGLRVRLQKFDPYINVDPGHDEPVPARRGLRPRRRRRDRPRPRPLRAVHQRPPHPRLQLHHRQDLPVGHPEGARGATTRARPSRSSRTSPTRSRPPSASWPTDDVDVVITEIGGTVGDIEGLPFLEAIRQFALDVGKRELPVHPPDARPLPEGGRRAEDQADAALASARCGRSASSPTSSSAGPSSRSAPRTSDKIALFCNVEPRGGHRGARQGVQHLRGAARAWSNNRLDDLIVEQLGLQGRAARHRRLARDGRPDHAPRPRGDDRRRRQVHEAPRRLQVGLRVARPRRASPTARGCIVRRVEAEEVEQRRGRAGCSAGVDGILVPGGFGMRGIEGKIEAIRYAREQRHPVLRHLPGHAVRGDRVRPQRARPGRRQHAPSSTRTRQHPVDLPDGRAARRSRERGGTMRLGRVRRAGSRRTAWPAQAYGARRDQRAAPPPLRVQQRLPRARSSEHGLRRHRHEPRRRRSSRSSSCPTTRGSWPSSSTPSSSRSRPRPTRCSATSSPPALSHRAEKKADPGRSRGHALAGAS